MISFSYFWLFFSFYFSICFCSADFPACDLIYSSAYWFFFFSFSCCKASLSSSSLVSETFLSAYFCSWVSLLFSWVSFFSPSSFAYMRRLMLFITLSLSQCFLKLTSWSIVWPPASLPPSNFSSRSFIFSCSSLFFFLRNASFLLASSRLSTVSSLKDLTGFWAL
jgi:hypothetical protein